VTKFKGQATSGVEPQDRRKNLTQNRTGVLLIQALEYRKRTRVEKSPTSASVADIRQTQLPTATGIKSSIPKDGSN